jgi:hypothetical protein
VAVVGKVFGKPTVTQTMAGEEPMVTLDAAAITQRIGAIRHVEKPQDLTAALAAASRAQRETAEPRWRSYLRPRPVMPRGS